jgi:hypothetical protein
MPASSGSLERSASATGNRLIFSEDFAQSGGHEPQWWISSVNRLLFVWKYDGAKSRRLYSLKTGEFIRFLETDESGECPASRFSSDGRYLATTMCMTWKYHKHGSTKYDRKLHVYQTSDWGLVQSVSVGAGGRSLGRLSFSDDGFAVAYAEEDTVWYYGPRDTTRIRTKTVWEDGSGIRLSLLAGDGEIASRRPWIRDVRLVVPAVSRPKCIARIAVVFVNKSIHNGPSKPTSGGRIWEISRNRQGSITIDVIATHTDADNPFYFHDFLQVNEPAYDCDFPVITWSSDKRTLNIVDLATVRVLTKIDMSNDFLMAPSCIESLFSEYHYEEEYLGRPIVMGQRIGHHVFATTQKSLQEKGSLEIWEVTSTKLSVLTSGKSRRRLIFRDGLEAGSVFGTQAHVADVRPSDDGALVSALVNTGGRSFLKVWRVNLE